MSFDDEAAAPVLAGLGQEYAVRYGEIVSRSERAGHPIDGFDAQIASICCEHDAALATRNATDFQHAGVPVIDPWGEATP